MVTKEQYLVNPCRTSSLPYWKTKSISIPDNLLILHDAEFSHSKYQQYIDAPYFRLSHDLQNLSAPKIPEGFSLCSISLKEYADHINACYDEISTSESELRRYTTQAVYNDRLWVALEDTRSGIIVATGIADLDREIGEGILEWIQVSEAYRRNGLGRYIVLELLWRMKDIANFVTVSGQCDNKTNPELLYRKCGFVGTDVWHILKQK